MRDTGLWASISLVVAADLIGRRIFRALERSARTTVIWSGGRTPKSIVPYLCAVDIDWSQVTFLMGDERWVPLDDPASNEGEMLRYIGGTPLEAARVTGLYRPGLSREAALLDLEPEVSALLNAPACAALLGMGPDGHTASLFPGGAWLGLDENQLVTPGEGPVEATPARMSLTPAALKRCEALYLLCNSPEKQDVWERVQAGADPATLPVAALLHPGAPRPILVA